MTGTRNQGATSPADMAPPGRRDARAGAAPTGREGPGARWRP
jgi:hypothetical protein